MMGIDLVLPDFTYLRERVDDIEAIVITHGHEDHLGALPWVLRELGQDSVPVVYGGQLTIAMARSKLDEHKLARRGARGAADRRGRPGGPVRDRARPPDALDPRCRRRRAHDRRWAPSWSPATTSSTRRRSTAGPPTSPGWPSSGARACCCSAATRRTPTGRGCRRPSRSSGPNLERVFAALRGPHRRHLLRLEHPPRPAGRRRRGSRSGARSRWSGRSMRKNVNIGRSLGHIDVPDGKLIQAREIDQWADERLVIISTGSQGEPLSALRRMAYRDHPQVELHAGRHRRLLGHADPRQRARRQRDDRPALSRRLRRRHHARRRRSTRPDTATRRSSS